MITCYKGLVPALAPSIMLSEAGTCLYFYIWWWKQMRRT